MTTLTRQRIKWTEDMDETLQQLVAEHGHAWTRIATALNLKGKAMHVRRRWESLQPMTRSMWTKAEDAKLARAITNLMARDISPQEHGWWVMVAEEVGTGRTPRQCQARWAKTLIPRQGRVPSAVRFDGIALWHWTPDEEQRLRQTIKCIETVADQPDVVEQCEKDEPWLLFSRNTPPRYFWNFVSSQVGPRTPAQCISKWFALNKSAKSQVTSAMTCEDIVRLVKFVRTQDTKRWIEWTKKFPGYTWKQLYSAYRNWCTLEQRYKTDLLSIDPLSMIQDFDGRSAMRPTDSNGYYDKDGELVKVTFPGKAGPLGPYILALMKYYPPGSRRAGYVQSFARLGNASGLGAGGRMSSETMDKLVSAITRYRNDWVGISREMGLPIRQCRRHADALAKRLGSVQRLITDPELEELEKHTKKPDRGIDL
ncbi:Myblike DNAbinding domain-containing protein [Linderina pennispora]|nr:Myblike DNAbinding domain-containing protein [Linderina pennispora]